MHVNNGIYFTLPQTKVWINEQYESNFRELLKDSYAELYRMAATYDVALCIENTGNFQLPYIRRALDQLSVHDNFYLTWDVGHDAKAGFAEESFFAHYSNRIKHMHLHDYNGKSDHQALYTGIVPINNRLEFARTHDCSVVIEVKTSDALAQSVASLRENRFL